MWLLTFTGESTFCALMLVFDCGASIKRLFLLFIRTDMQEFNNSEVDSLLCLTCFQIGIQITAIFNFLEDLDFFLQPLALINLAVGPDQKLSA